MNTSIDFQQAHPSQQLGGEIILRVHPTSSRPTPHPLPPLPTAIRYRRLSERGIRPLPFGVHRGRKCACRVRLFALFGRLGSSNGRVPNCGTGDTRVDPCRGIDTNRRWNSIETVTTIY